METLRYGALLQRLFRHSAAEKPLGTSHTSVDKYRKQGKDMMVISYVKKFMATVMFR